MVNEAEVTIKQSAQTMLSRLLIAADRLSVTNQALTSDLPLLAWPGMGGLAEMVCHVWYGYGMGWQRHPIRFCGFRECLSDGHVLNCTHSSALSGAERLFRLCDSCCPG